MKVDVVLFASLREEVGPTFAVELSGPESTVRTLREALAAAHPSFARIGRKALVAVNEEWSRDSDPVREGDTVALVPPVAGG